MREVEEHLENCAYLWKNPDYAPEMYLYLCAQTRTHGWKKIDMLGIKKPIQQAKLQRYVALR